MLNKKISMLMMKYLQSFFCQYDISDYHGKHNILFNVFDAVFLLLYIILAIVILWLHGVRALTFIATVIIIMRYIINFIKKAKELTTRECEVVLSYYYRVIVLASLSVCLVIFYFAIEYNKVLKIFLTIYYTTFAFFEFTDILADCYSAHPRLYIRKMQSV